MKLDDETIMRYRMALFAVNERDKVLSHNSKADIEYACGVLKRFKEICPDAILILKNVVIGSPEWKDEISQSHIKCKTNREWEFYNADHGIWVILSTDGSIDVSDNN